MASMPSSSFSSLGSAPIAARSKTPGISTDQDSMTGPVGSAPGASNAPGAGAPGVSGGTPATPTFGSTPTGSTFWNGGSTSAPSSDNGSTEQNLTTTGRMSDATLQAGQQAGQDRSQFESALSSGQGALNNYISAALSAAMPSFNAQMQQVNEGAARRGISNGDLSTSYEGDLASAFQRNIANATAGQAMNLYSTQLGAEQKQLNTDTADYASGLTNANDIATATKNRKAAGMSALFGGIGSLAGAIPGVGTVLGPALGAVGSAAGAMGA